MPKDLYIYGVVLVALGVIVGLFITVSKPILKLNSTLTEILTKLQLVEKQVNGFTDSNHESHRRIHDRINNVEEDVNELKLKVHSSNKK